MAINYLSSINLNRNELQDAQLIRAQVENQPNDAAVNSGATPVTGQIYYNTTAGELRQYNGTAWVSVGDITSLTQGTNINITDSSGPSPTINLIDNPTLAGNLTISKNQPVLIINDTTASDLNLEIKQSGSTTVFKSRGGTSSKGQFNFQITDGSTPTNALFINQQARATFAGDVVIDGGDITLGGTGRIQGVDTVTDGTDATNKTYVDDAISSAVTGLLEFKGGFDADTGTLDDGSGDDLYTDVVIAVGDYYVVTTAGDFFGNTDTPLTVGDSVIAKNAVPDPATTAAVESDFIVVQSDTDLATATTVGIGNVNAGTGISVAYSNGTATVTNTQNNSDNSATGTITAGNLSGTVTHAFGINTIVQTIDSSGNTVYCDISRTATTSVATIATAEATDITILVQKIG